MAERVIWSQGKMYISSNWILAKAFRTVLCMGREWSGAAKPWGCDSSHSQREAVSRGHWLGEVPSTRNAWSTQCGLSVVTSESHLHQKQVSEFPAGQKTSHSKTRLPWLHLTRQSYLRPANTPHAFSSHCCPSAQPSP